MDLQRRASPPPLIRTRADREAERLNVAQVRWRFAAAFVVALAGMLLALAAIAVLV